MDALASSDEPRTRTAVYTTFVPTRADMTTVAAIGGHPLDNGSRYSRGHVCCTSLQ